MACPVAINELKSVAIRNMFFIASINRGYHYQKLVGLPFFEKL